MIVPIRLLISCLIVMLPGLALAAQPLTLTHQVFVEKTALDSHGQAKIILSAANQVAPGDQLIFVLRYFNPGHAPSAHLLVTDPLPPAVAYQQAGNDALVSVDGGKNWGTLSSLFIAEQGGRRRSARPEDVTHIRWQLSQPVPAGGTGKLTFRGMVR
jgi:uncharacterized repeat protein (TIGR01451 family)